MLKNVKGNHHYYHVNNNLITIAAQQKQQKPGSTKKRNEWSQYRKRAAVAESSAIYNVAKFDCSRSPSIGKISYRFMVSTYKMRVVDLILMALIWGQNNRTI